jgi:hypothetical protein
MPPVARFFPKSALSEAVVWHKDADGTEFGFDWLEAISQMPAAAPGMETQN